MNKKDLRAAVSWRRRALSDQEVLAASTAIQERVLGLSVFKAARVIMAYADCRNEVQTGGLIRMALAAGKRIVLPVTDIENKEIRGRAVRHYPEDLEPGAFDVLEPQALCPLVLPDELDLIIVPGVAFDRQGFRLGYGGGYYDRFLPLTTGTTIGIAYQFQMVATVYPEAHDWRVDCVITEHLEKMFEVAGGRVDDER